MDLAPAAPAASAAVPVLAAVPAPPATRRLHVAACVGNRVLVVPLGGGDAQDAAPAVTTVQWCVRRKREGG